VLTPEPAEPRFVVTFVHGTFANSRDPWLQSGGPFALGLRRRLAPIHFPDTPFGWSGRNLAEARAQAARDLRTYLQALIERYPAAHHVIVAHSHGGSVVFAALADQWFADHILGVVTLGTPFITLSRNVRKPPFGAADGIIAALFSGVAVFAAGVALGHGRSWWPRGLLTAGVVAAALALGAYVSEAMARRAQRFVEMTPRTRLRPEQVAIVRTTADEAAFALFSARVASRLVWLAWERVIGPVERGVRTLLDSIDHLGFRELERSVMKTSSTRFEPLAALRLETPSGAARNGFREQLPATIGAALPSILALLEGGNPWVRLFAFLLLVGYGLPALAALLVAVATIPFGIIVALGRFPCGWTFPLAGQYLDLSVEPAPPDTWSVTHFDASDEVISHGLAHDDPRVIQFAAEWITARAAEHTSLGGNP
jgi:hypothetical protein